MDHGRDLGAMAHSLVRLIVDRETPLLRAEGLTMWDYVVLGGLAGGAAPTQAQLADATGRDRTRLIPILDRLERAGLVDRTPDPADRRNRIVALTGSGRATLARSRAAIRAMEDELLADIDPADRAALRRTLERLVP